MGGRGLSGRERVEWEGGGCEWEGEVVSGFGWCVVGVAAKLVTISVTNDLLITFEICNRHTHAHTHTHHTNMHTHWTHLSVACRPTAEESALTSVLESMAVGDFLRASFSPLPVSGVVYNTLVAV